MKETFADLKADIAQERLRLAQQKAKASMSFAQLLISILNVKQILKGVK